MIVSIFSATNDPRRANKLWQLLNLCSLAGWCLISGPVCAQVTPDGTLETEVNTINNDTEITGGTKADSNLFHSFQDFSLHLKKP